jgi:RNA polymerase sigma-70 factor (ECF subfamily)
MGGSISTLLTRAVDGDDDALSSLLEQFGPQIRAGLSIGPAYRALLDPDDVMQVTFIEAFLQIQQLSTADEDAFVAWLRQIAQNNLRDAIRALECDKRLSPKDQVAVPRSDDSTVALFDLVGASASTPSRRASTDEIRKIVESAIRTLPPDYAAVIRLFDLEGHGGLEVAAALGRSRGAVHMLRARAHDQLRERLGSSSRFFSDGI